VSLFILDTNILSHYQSGHPVVRQNVAARQPGEVVLTIITVEESVSGWLAYIRRARRPDRLALGYERLARAVESLTGWTILPFPLAAIARFDQLKAMRLGVGGYDLRIGAIALEHGATVVTRNRTDFGCIPGLTVVDWWV
jgi:predicted nucleic acid-binding protein